MVIYAHQTHTIGMKWRMWNCFRVQMGSFQLKNKILLQNSCVNKGCFWSRGKWKRGGYMKVGILMMSIFRKISCAQNWVITIYKMIHYSFQLLHLVDHLEHFNFQCINQNIRYRYHFASILHAILINRSFSSSRINQSVCCWTAYQLLYWYWLSPIVKRCYNV